VPPTQPVGAPLGQPVPPLGPPVASGPPSAPAKSGIGRGPIIGIVAAVLVVLAAVVFFATKGDDNKKNAAATESSSSSDSTSSSRSKSSSSSSTSSSSNADIPAGFKEIRNDEEGVSLAVPRNFVEIKPDSISGALDSDSVASLNPEIAPLLGAGGAFIGNAVLAASGSGQMILVGKLPGGAAIDATDPAFADALKSEFDSLGIASNVVVEPTSLPAGDALHVGLTISLNTASVSGATVTESLFFVTVKGTTWGLIGVSTNGDDAVFDQIAQTFTVS